MAERTPEIDILVAAEDWRDSGLRAEETAVAAATAALRGRDLPETDVELSLLLTDDASIAKLNVEWRGKPGPTNVLSFPGDMSGPGPRMLGDIAIAYETVVSEAVAAGIPVADHLSHLVVHGVLHLLGYDHETDADAEAMESEEVAVLLSLDIADPYAAADRRLAGADQ